jgi:polyferredoxin
VVRPRVLVYGALLLAVFAGFVFGILNRTPLILDVMRDRNALYRTAADGGIENGYTLRIVNKDIVPRTFTVRIEGAEGIVLVEAGATHAAAAEQVLTVPVTLRAPAGVAKGRIDLRVVVESDAGVKAVEETRFFGPF